MTDGVRRKLVVGGVLIALIGVACLAGSALAWRQLRQYLQDRVEAAVGPGQYDVKLRASWLDLLRGRVPGITILGRDVRMEGRPELERFELDATDLRLANDALTELGRLRFTAAVTQEALNAWLPTRSKRGEHEPEEQVTLGDGRLEVRFVLRKGALSPPVTGTLQASGAAIELTLDMKRLRAVLPAVVVRAVERRTLVDLSDNPLGIEMGEVRVETGRIVVEGTARPKLPMPLAPSDRRGSGSAP